MEANIELLMKVRNYIGKYPQAIDMRNWEKRTLPKASEARLHPDSWDGCARCIGGNVIALTGGAIERSSKWYDHNFDRARARLGLSVEETKNLLYFCEASIDGPYRDLRDSLLCANQGSPEYAAVVIKAIDRCIERHSPQPDPIDREASAVCAAVESEMKAKSLLTRNLSSKETVFASLAGVAVLATAFAYFIV